MKAYKNNFLFIGAIIFIAVLVTVGRGWAIDDETKNDDAKHPSDKTKFFKFSHSKHAEQGVNCATCHTAILEKINSSDKALPGHEQCQSCHEEKVTSNCGFCHSNAEDPKALPKQVRDITFNHKFHIGEQKMECVTCHKNVEKTDFASAANHPSMSTCTTCHNNKKTHNECITCHQNVTNLRPSSHSLISFKKEHGKVVRLRTMDAQCQSCHSNNFCEQCHDGSNLTKLNPKESIGMISPRTSGNEHGLALKGQMVHDMNFRFTHGIEAKGKSTDCQTCHRNQQFCSDCHINGSAALGGAIPTSHEQAGFVTIDFGFGGGTHAKLAKRDIQQCASCHDPEGGDPTCVTCHVDSDGIKGTNPKTHVLGFMKNVKDEWRNDAGANCYICHTDANANPKGQSGVGFCGYCHGKK